MLTPFWDAYEEVDKLHHEAYTNPEQTASGVARLHLPETAEELLREEASIFAEDDFEEIREEANLLGYRVRW